MSGRQLWRKLLPWYFPPYYNKDFFDPAALNATEGTYARDHPEKYADWKHMEVLLYPQNVGQASSDLRPVAPDDLTRIPPWFGLMNGISGGEYARAEAQFAMQHPDEYTYWKRVEQLKRQGGVVPSAQDLTPLSANFEFVRKHDIQLTSRLQLLGLLVAPIGFISYLWADDNDWWAHALVFAFLGIGAIIAAIGALSDREQVVMLVAQENEERLLAAIRTATRVAISLQNVRTHDAPGRGTQQRLAEVGAQARRVRRRSRHEIEADEAQRRQAKARKESMEQQEAASTLGVAAKRCQYCTLFIPETSTLCQHCGNDV